MERSQNQNQDYLAGEREREAVREEGEEVEEGKFS